MSDDAKLQKVVLGPDWIDLSFGEPKIIFDALFKNIDTSFKMPTLMSLKNYEYQPAQGMPKLTDLLQKKYGTKVVVTNGAKHGLGAVMYALKKNGFSDIYYDKPYYPGTPSLAETAGLSEAPFYKAKAILFTSPSNPDGKNYSNLHMNAFTDNTYVVHDAAYYTPIYLPTMQTPTKIGHVQVYSLSKMYGLSGLRIGYVVCHDETLFKDIVDFVEMTSAGVSTASQDIAFEIEKYFIANPDKLKRFEAEARSTLAKNRKILKDLHPDVAILSECDSNSMFGWFKKGPKLNADEAKVYMLDGSIFGDSTMIRMNIAVSEDLLRSAIDRLNSHKK